MQRYIALVHKEKSSQYGVMFPDFPGCIAAAATLDDAVEEAKEALAFHVEGMRQDREKIPAPRSLEEIRAAGEDWIEWDDAVAVAIPLLPPSAGQERVNIMLDRNLLAAADKRARAGKQTRSALINRALELLLES